MSDIDDCIYMFLSFLDIQLKSKKYFYSGKYGCCAGTSSYFFFFEMVIKTAWFANATTSFMIIVGPNNGDNVIFFPSCRVLNLIHGRRNYLQMHLLVR
jgi:hypothetical protein